MARIAIVILNYNGISFLEKFLPSVIQHSPGCQVVVADNCSMDQSCRFVEENFPQIQLIKHETNFGFCEGYNRALFQLNADYFVLLNSDVEVTPDWIEPIMKLFDQDLKIAAIQPKLLDFYQKSKFEYAGGAGGFIDRLGYPFCRGRIFGDIETDHGQYNDTREVFWASGACLFIRSDLFKQYGGFDNSFFAHMEEIDLCWRMKKDGYKIVACGASVVYHVGGGTLTYANPRKTYLNFRNSLMVLIKNLPLGQLAWKLPARWMIDYLAFTKFVLTGNFLDGIMIFKAHFYLIANFWRVFKKRNSSSHQARLLSGIFPGFLLFQHHLRGVSKFSDLKF